MKAALVGNGIAQSVTPGLHEAEGAAQGLSYRYERFDTALSPWKGMALSDILDHAETEGYAGLNITHPHKLSVTSYLDALSGPAKALGAVNTVVFQDGKRVGHTTDYSGFDQALKVSGLITNGARVVQFGAGGAGAATALALIDAGVSLRLVDCDKARAETLAEHLRAARPKAVIKTGAGDLRRANGVVNATPLGMKAYPGMAFDPAALGADAWVADIVYAPLNTALLNAARARGLRVMDGGGMALYQAVAAFELITGHRADATRMRISFDQLMAAREGRAPDKGAASHVIHGPP